MRKVKKNDRKFKDIAQIAEEEKVYKTKLEGTIEDLNNKNSKLKSQLEDSEQLSSTNLSKYRRIQVEFEGMRTRAELAESQLASYKLRSRMSAQVNNFVVYAYLNV